MKTTPRIRVNGSTNSTRRQVSLNTRAVKPLAPPRLENGNPAPVVVLKEFESEVTLALDELQRAGAAAVALAMLNGDSIRVQTKEFQPKEELPAAYQEFCEATIERGPLQRVHPSLENGTIDLPLTVALKFDETFGLWRDDQRGILEGRKPQNATRRWTVENVVEAINHLLKEQGCFLVNYFEHDSGALQCAFIASDRLNNAWHKAWALENKMLNALDGGHRASEFAQAV